jgi:hypothetical protein
MGTWKKVITVADDDNYKNENLTLAQLDTALDGANGYAANKILKVNSAGNAVEWDDDEGGIALTDLSVGAEQAASGDGAISYDSSSGVFKYAPPVHDSLHGFVADEHIDHSGVTITAGTGLTGGGTIEATRTLNVAGGDGITANADDIEVDSTVVRTSGAQTVAGDKTFSGDCSFTGSTTYISTAELKVEDTAIVLAVPDSAYGSDNDAQTGADGAGILVHSDSTVADAKFAGITWNKDGKLTGWQARDTNGVADFAIAIMETSGDGTEPDGDAAGLGSLHFDTGDATLYVRTA